MKSRNRKVGHAHTRVKGKPPEKSGTWRCVESCFPAGFSPTCRLASCASESEVSDRRRAGRKSHRGQGDPMTVAVRRSDDEGFQKENKVTGRKHDHRKKKLGFPFWL